VDLPEGGFAGVGVADEADGEELTAASDLALGAVLDSDEVFLEAVDAFSDESAVDLELLLAWATGTDPSLDAFEVAPHGFEPGEGVLELCELDLESGLGGAGAGGEDIEDELGAVDDLDAGELLEGADLSGGEVAVGDDDVGIEGGDEVVELAGLSGTEIEGGVGSGATLEESSDDVRSGGAGEAVELFEGLFLEVAAGEAESDEDSALSPDGSVLCVEIGHATPSAVQDDRHHTGIIPRGQTQGDKGRGFHGMAREAERTSPGRRGRSLNQIVEPKRMSMYSMDSRSLRCAAKAMRLSILSWVEGSPCRRESGGLPQRMRGPLRV